MFSLALDQTFQYISVGEETKSRIILFDILVNDPLGMSCTILVWYLQLFRYTLILIVVCPNFALVSTNFIDFFFYLQFIYSRHWNENMSSIC